MADIYTCKPSGDENGSAGRRLVQGVCPDVMSSSVNTGEVTRGGGQICYQKIKTTVSQTVLSISYTNWQGRWDDVDVWDDWLAENECLPALNDFYDPGSALRIVDPWYVTGNGAPGPLYDYKLPPPDPMTRGVRLPRRQISDLDIRFSDEDRFGIVKDRNSSRKATAEELLKHLGILACLSPDCRDEKAAFGLDEKGNPMRRLVEATATDTASSPMKSGCIAVREHGADGDSMFSSRQLLRPERMMVEVTGGVSNTRAPEPTRQPEA